MSDFSHLPPALLPQDWELCPKCANRDGGCPFCGHGYVPKDGYRWPTENDTLGWGDLLWGADEGPRLRPSSLASPGEGQADIKTGTTRSEDEMYQSGHKPDQGQAGGGE